jgi:hypothetical protein
MAVAEQDEPVAQPVQFLVPFAQERASLGRVFPIAHPKVELIVRRQHLLVPASQPSYLGDARLVADFRRLDFFGFPSVVSTFDESVEAAFAGHEYDSRLDPRARNP